MRLPIKHYDGCLKCDLCPRVEPPKMIKTPNGIFCNDCIVVMAKIGKLYFAHETYYKKIYPKLKEFLCQ